MGTHTMFDRKAARTMRRAAQEARALRHGAVETEHILLALLRDADVVELLASAGITDDDVRSALRERVPAGSRPIALDGDPPLAPLAADALRCTAEEAEGLGDRRWRNPHLLLGLLKQDDGAGTQVLASWGASLDAMRHEVLEQTAALALRPRATAGSRAPVQELHIDVQGLRLPA